MSESTIRIPRRQYEELKSTIGRLKAQHESNRKNIGRPGYLYATMADYEEKREQGRFIMQYLKNLSKRNYNEIDRMKSEFPEWFVGKANFNETTDAQGGYTVPVLWANRIYDAVENYGFARRMFDIYPMGSRKVNIQTDSSFTAAFVAETAVPTVGDSTSFYGNAQLEAKFLKAALILSEAMMEDAVPETVDRLTRKLALAIAKEEDRVAFNGDVVGNSDAFDGICVVSGTNSIDMGSGDTAFTDITWTDLLDLHAQVKTGTLDNAVFVTSRSVFNSIRKETDTANGRPIWNLMEPGLFEGQVGLQGLERSTYWGPLGYPMVVVPDAVWPTSGADTTAVAFGYFSEYAIFGERRGLTTKVFDQQYGSTSLSGHSQAIELSERIAISFPEPDAFAVLKTAAS